MHLHRNSREHFAAIAQIDLRYNAMLEELKKRTDLRTQDRQLREVEVELLRETAFADMRARLTDA